MRAISANETTRKRSAVAPKRASTCTLKRPTLASDSAGGSTTSWSTIGTYSCRVAPGTPYNFPMEVLAASQIKATSVWTIGMPYSTTVQTEDIIEIGSDHFEVIGQWGSKSPMTELKVVCSKVE